MDTQSAAVFMWVSNTVGGQPRCITRLHSNEANAVYRLEFETRPLILKTGPNLEREYVRLGWLEGRLPAPRPFGFTSRDGVDAVLMSVIDGENLAKLRTVLPPATIIHRLAHALKCVHAVSIADWPFGGTGSVLVHGDACLPNFLYDGDAFSSCIDIGDMALGEPEVDLSAAVWTLQYNLGPGHGRAFLEEYGWHDADDATIEMLRLRYEQG